MPLTTVIVRRRHRGRYGWYPIAEAIWAWVAIVAIALIPFDSLAPLVTAAIVAPGAFFGSVRVIAEIADAKAGR